jgi:hypothetical protein
MKQVQKRLLRTERRYCIDIKNIEHINKIALIYK